MRDIPEFFKNGYTLGGKVRVIDYYFNEGANRRYYHYPRDFVEMFINKAKDKKQNLKFRFLQIQIFQKRRLKTI